MTPQALVRLLMGHTGIDQASVEDGFVASTSTAIEMARILFPPEPIWRSPLEQCHRLKDAHRERGQSGHRPETPQS